MKLYTVIRRKFAPIILNKFLTSNINIFCFTYTMFLHPLRFAVLTTILLGNTKSVIMFVSKKNTVCYNHMDGYNTMQ